MKKLVVLLIFGLQCFVYSNYNPSYPAGTIGKGIPQFALQSVFQSTYGAVNTQQEHFIGFFEYGFLDILNIGITANYHIIDIKTPVDKERKMGIGDPALFARWTIYNNTWIILGLKCDLNVPLGNKDFTAHTFTHNSIFISEFNLVYLRPYITFGHYTTDKTNGFFRFNFGIQKKMIESWTVFVDSYTEITQRRNTSHIPCYIVIGSIIRFGNNAFKTEYIINTKKFSSEKGFFALRYMYNFKNN